MANDFPCLAEVVGEMVAKSGYSFVYEFGLDLILDNLERLRGAPEHQVHMAAAVTPRWAASTSHD